MIERTISFIKIPAEQIIENPSILSSYTVTRFIQGFAECRVPIQKNLVSRTLHAYRLGFLKVAERAGVKGAVHFHYIGYWDETQSEYEYALYFVPEKQPEKEDMEHTTDDPYSEDLDTHTNEHGGKQSNIPGRFDLLPPDAIAEVAAVLKHGADKYGVDNWRSIPVDDHINHALRHLFGALKSGSKDDLSHAACRTLFALELYGKEIK